MCSVTSLPVVEYMNASISTLEDIFDECAKIDFPQKTTGKYGNKKCDIYYDTKIDDFAVYVYEDYIYAIHSGEKDDVYDLILDYTWKAPMKDFVFDHKECVEQEKKLAETPSDDFVLCAASNLRVAFFTLLVALVTILF